MTKIEQIQYAISEANMFRSKLTPEALAVPGYTSLKIRHLMNNLGAISINFFEIGSHRGGTLCSGIFGNSNLLYATAVDNFSEFNEEGSPMKELISNVAKFKQPDTQFNLLIRDCWSIGEESIPSDVDFYLYDGNHGAEEQEKACYKFLSSMAKEFIFCVDDYSVWPHVKIATQKGIQQSGCEVLFEQELFNGVEGDNFGFHNGLGVFYLRKP